MTALSDTAPARETRLLRLWNEFRDSRVAVTALGVVAVLTVLAAAAPWIAPQNPYDLAQLSILDNMLPPGSRRLDGMIYWLGTDDQGRDLLSAILYGLRLSLLVAAAATALGLAIGAAAGIVAAYVGGRIDAAIMRIVDIQLSFPTILIALILLAVLGKGVDKVVLALAPARIMFRHLLPNAFPPLIVVATVQAAHAISLEATLSFLDVGVPVTKPSLGLLIANGYSYMLSGLYWIAFYPGIALLVAIL